MTEQMHETIEQAEARVAEKDPADVEIIVKAGELERLRAKSEIYDLLLIANQANARIRQLEQTLTELN